MTSEVRLGIVGCGKVAEFHARAIKNLKGCRLAAACGRTRSKVEAFCQKHRIEGYLDLEDMIEKARLDAVTICTPHPSHASLSIRAAQAGCHVLVEKPMAVTVEQCDAMISAAREHKVLLGVLVQRRNYLPCLRIRNAIDAGKIGRPVLGQAIMLGFRSEEYYRSDPWRGTWAGEGGGALVTQASHQIDLLNWYMGEIEAVYGRWANYTHPSIEVEDSAVAVIQYKGGGMAVLLASNCQNPALYGKVHIFGDNGAGVGVQTDGGQMFIAGMSTILTPPVLDLWTVKGEEHLLEQMNAEDTAFFNSVDQMIYFHQRHLENFVNAIKGTEPLLADGEAGRSTVEICQAVYESGRNPQKVWLSSGHRRTGA